MSVWAEYLEPETCRPLAVYDHPVFGDYPAVTRNEFGKGVLTYEGTFLSDELQDRLVADCLAVAGIPAEDAALPPGVKAKHARLADGAAVHAYFNFSAARHEFVYGRAGGLDLLTGVAVAAEGPPRPRALGLRDHPRRAVRPRRPGPHRPKNSVDRRSALIIQSSFGDVS